MCQLRSWTGNFENSWGKWNWLASLSKSVEYGMLASKRKGYSKEHTSKTSGSR